MLGGEYVIIKLNEIWQGLIDDLQDGCLRQTELLCKRCGRLTISATITQGSREGVALPVCPCARTFDFYLAISRT
jgi:hypothetical protein